MTAFKILSKENGRLFSFSVPAGSIYRLEYKENETVFPIGGSKLFVFGSLESALDVFGSSPVEETYEIWEVEVSELENLDFSTVVSTIMDKSIIDGHFNAFWETKALEVFFKAPVLSGTLFCSSIKLIKKIL